MMNLGLASDAASATCPHTTVIFLDVDGVLNAGVRDDTNCSPLLLSTQNVKIVRKMAERGELEQASKRLLSLLDRKPGHGEGAVEALAADTNTHISEVFVQRLAQIIKAAGSKESVKVVLSSSWRKTTHRHRVMSLEAEISRHLNYPFSFDDKTALAFEGNAEDRLRLIGDYLSQHYTSYHFNSNTIPARLNVLVLDDFFVTPFGGWRCGGMTMDSAEAAERYLLRRLPAQDTLPSEVRLVHSYDEWFTDQGMRVQVGVGLTQEHLCKAMAFVNWEYRGCDGCGGSIVGSGERESTSEEKNQGTQLKSTLSGKTQRGLQAVVSMMPWLFVH
mmetsp:Transcript_46296/g.91767  ORF Transcript_46296/g.91767 Transcript_46296/m.91767 type:complete len:331 (-) Transcript_46296:32-1024(-)